MRRAVLIGMLLLTASCRKEDCIVGARVSCACAGSSITGVQTCLESGSYGPCTGCPDSSDGAVGQGDGGASTPCESYCEAAAAKCSLIASYQQLCVQDCQAAVAKQPASCQSQGDALLTCGASLSAWSCQNGQATLTGCSEQQGIRDLCVWDATPCSQLGGTLTGLGACAIICYSDADCPLPSLRCWGAGTSWGKGFCHAESGSMPSCGTAGWTTDCGLKCSVPGGTGCPTGFCCAASAIGGDNFCSGLCTGG
jgi:hypothetical protein